MTIERRTIVYDGPGGPFEGVFAWDGAQTGPRPVASRVGTANPDRGPLREGQCQRLVLAPARPCCTNS
jgi:hypothetical protein